MEKSNPFDILDVAPDATPEDIKKAFRKMAKRYHPDITGDSGEKFKRILMAYEQLSGYATGVAGPQDFDWAIRVSIDRKRDNVQDLFDDLRDGILTFFDIDAPEYLNLFLELTPAQAERGGTVKLEVPLVRKCRSCYGFGKIFFVACKSCGGSGEESYVKDRSITIPAGIDNGWQTKIKIDNLYMTVVFRVLT